MTTYVLKRTDARGGYRSRAGAANGVTFWLAEAETFDFRNAAYQAALPNEMPVSITAILSGLPL